VVRAIAKNEKIPCGKKLAALTPGQPTPHIIQSQKRGGTGGKKKYGALSPKGDYRERKMTPGGEKKSDK